MTSKLVWNYSHSSWQPKDKISMKSQILFSQKNKKKYFKMSSADIITQHAECFKPPASWI